MLRHPLLRLLLYSVVLTALPGTTSAIIVDYSAYCTIPATIVCRCRVQARQCAGMYGLIILAYVASIMVGGFFSDPLNNVSRNLAVTAV